ncbi:Sphingosine kinase 1 [Amphibalanus amphitrite]|uniref:Sphingosine kinase 1 n=1 Tax=Amphibalanus amphitrite TaxID=1232801 RepID=A0A6A4VEC1_AMPAM|nr:Sphingosine kinase 1 [Amphibalanus amphitrite]
MGLPNNGISMCQHVGKSVSLADIKRQLKSNRWIGACDKKVPTPCTAPADGEEQSVPSGAQLPHGVWLCMQCGHQGCARHATQHFNTPRSDSHTLAVNAAADWGVWCFTCNEKVSLKSNKKLHEAVQFVKKKQGTLRPGATPSKEDTPPPKSSKGASAKEKQAQADCDNESLPKVKGLINLGNSCYLNSVLQCLSQCHYLTHYLDISSRSGRKVTVSANGETMKLVLPEGGPITASLCDFLKKMHITGTGSTVSPSHLLKKIALKVPQFVGCDQQDAHELLRALMEQARLEDLRRHQKQILLGLGLPAKADPKEVPDDMKARAKALGRQASHTTIDSIFSGQLVSLVVPLSELDPPPASVSGESTEDELNEPPASVSPDPPADEPPASVSPDPPPDEPPASVSPDPPADLGAEELSERLSALIVDRAGAAAAADSCGDEPGPLTVNGRPSSPVEADAAPAGLVPLVGESADKAPNGAPETAGADQVGEKQSSVPAENCGEAVEARENSLGAPNGHCRRAAEEAPREGQSPSPVCAERRDLRANRVCPGRKGGDPSPAANPSDGPPPPLSRCEWLSRALTTLAPRYQAAAGECSLLTCLNQYTAPELLTGNNKFGCDNCTELRNKRLTAAEKAAEKKLGTVYSNASKQLLIYSPPPVLTIHLKRFEVCSFSLRKVNRHVQFGERLDLAPFCSSISQDLPQMRAGQRRVLYSLFGVVEHSGRLTSGHYTAYVRVRRRHDQLTVNPARLTTLVTDAFAVACERARQRAEQTRPETTDGPSPVRPAEEGRDDGEGEDPAAAPQESQTDQKQPAPEPETEPEPQPEAGRWFYVSDTHVTEVTLDKVLKAQAYMLFYERIVFGQRVLPILSESDAPHEVVVTSRAGEARQLAAEADLSQWSAVVIVSGDGLLYEVYNGILSRADWHHWVDFPVALVPAGSGNGMAASVAHASNLLPAFLQNPVLTASLALAKRLQLQVDLMMVRTQTEELVGFLSLGWGLLADIDIESERLRVLGGARFTVWAAARLLTLKTYRGKVFYLPGERTGARTEERRIERPRLERAITIESGSSSAGGRRRPVSEGAPTTPASERDVFTELMLDQVPPPAESDPGRRRRSSADAEPGVARHQFPPLDQPPPDDWACIQGEFVLVYGSLPSHISGDMHLNPGAELSDGLLHLHIIRAGVTRSQVLRYLLGLADGQHTELPFVERIAVRAVRLVPETAGGYITLDGEVVQYGPVQAEVRRGLGRVLCPRLP